MTKKKSAAKDPPDIESALHELESLVDELETGELSLGESLEKFERGVNLARQCQKSLEQAEQKVRVLSEADADEDDGNQS